MSKFTHFNIYNQIHKPMLNIDLINTLYDGLPKERQQELITLLFKKSKQTMAYFKRTKDISLSKLETLADFFGMPLDYFRTNSSLKANNVAGNNNQVGNVSVNTNLMFEIDALRREVDGLKDTIRAKNETILSQKEFIENLKAQISLKN